MWIVLEHIGRVVAILLGLAALCLAVALAVAAWARRGHWVPLKRFSILVLDLVYLPLKLAFSLSGRLPSLDAMMVALKNQANRRRFTQARKRLLLAPTCLRAIKCPAASTRRGIQCIGCGLCKIAEMKAEAERLGYSFYLLTGSSFIARIVADEQPDAALLVACPYECNKVMMGLGRLTTFAVPLDRDGCVDTDVALERVSEAMELGLDDVPETARAETT